MKLDRSQIEADFRALIGPLCDAVGPSGFEDEVADLLRKELSGCDVELSDDVMGNLIAYKKGNKKGSVLIAAIWMRSDSSFATLTAKAFCG